MRVYIYEDLIKWPLNENEKFVRTLFYVFDDKLYQICFPPACVQIIVNKRFKTGAGALRINKYRNVHILQPNYKTERGPWPRKHKKYLTCSGSCRDPV